MERLGSLVVRDDDEAGGIGGANEVGKIEATCGCSEAGYTSAAGASTKVAAYTLECLRVFEVRQQFADKRENHSLSLLYGEAELARRALVKLQASAGAKELSLEARALRELLHKQHRGRAELAGAERH